MVPNITRFVPKAERIAAAKAEDARQAVLDLDLPETATDDILATIQRHKTGGLAGWRFNMINAAQVDAVIAAIDQGQAPYETNKVFFKMLTHIETNTGVVVLSRSEIAEKLNMLPRHVSRATKRLEEIGAVIRQRVKVPGMRGPGKVRYRINPHVAWNGSLDRRAAQAGQAAPVQERLPLEVIEGGAPA